MDVGASWSNNETVEQTERSSKEQLLEQQLKNKDDLIADLMLQLTVQRASSEQRFEQLKNKDDEIAELTQQLAMHQDSLTESTKTFKAVTQNESQRGATAATIDMQALRTKLQQAERRDFDRKPRVLVPDDWKSSYERFMEEHTDELPELIHLDTKQPCVPYFIHFAISRREHDVLTAARLSSSTPPLWWEEPGCDSFSVLGMAPPVSTHIFVIIQYWHTQVQCALQLSAQLEPALKQALRLNGVTNKILIATLDKKRGMRLALQGGVEQLRCARIYGECNLVFVILRLC